MRYFAIALVCLLIRAQGPVTQGSETVGKKKTTAADPAAAMAARHRVARPVPVRATTDVRAGTPTATRAGAPTEMVAAPAAAVMTAAGTTEDELMDDFKKLRRERRVEKS